MALACAFIFIVIIWLYRRRQSKKRAEKAAQFAKGLSVKEKTGWLSKLLRFGKILLCHTDSRREPIVRPRAEDVKLNQLRMMEEARPVTSFTDYHNNVDSGGEGGREDQDLVQLIGSYNPLPETYYTNRNVQIHLADHQSVISDTSSQHTAPSIYSQVTGLPHNLPEPRQPLKSRFSMSTFATNEVRKNHQSGKKTFWKWSFYFLFFFFFCFLYLVLLFFFFVATPHTLFLPSSHLPNKHFRLYFHLCTHMHDPFMTLTKHLLLSRTYL